MAQTVKSLHVIWETWVQFLGLEDPLEKEIATHSSVLAWEIPWTKQPGGLQSMGLHTTEQLNNNNVMYCIVCIFSIYTVC